MRPMLRYVVAALAIASAGCSSTGVPKTGGPRHSPTAITEEEIAATTGITTVYDAIERLRPRWLTSMRGQTSLNSTELIQVYMDGTHYGTVESLRHLALSGVHSVTFLNARDATTRFGIGHSSGAIVVVLAAP